MAGGAWGGLAARGGGEDPPGRRPGALGGLQRLVRRGWPSSSASVGAGERGAPPASIVVLSGDVHHAYLFEVGFPRATGVRTSVWQAVCSPYRNPLDKKERRVDPAGACRDRRRGPRVRSRGWPGSAIRPIGWRMVGDGPWFDNQVATLTIDGRRMEMRLDKAVPVDELHAKLECVLDTRLA